MTIGKTTALTTQIFVPKVMSLLFNTLSRASQVVLVVKNLPENAEDIRDSGSIPRLETLEKGKATHSSTLAWRVPRTEEPGRLQSIGSQRVGRDCKKRRGKKEPPLWTVGEGLYWAVALGQNSRDG